MGKLSNDDSFLLMAVFLIIIVVGGRISFISSCIEEEREALLQFKASFVKEPGFVDPSRLLISWEATADCCQWDGVGCNETTGHVEFLNLQNLEPVDVYTSPPDFSSTLFAPNGVHSSLLRLKHLEYLDLSGHCFNYSQIPSFLGSMIELRYLNLSHAWFHGTVSHHLGNLSNLLYLDISDVYISPNDQYGRDLMLFIDNNVQWISGLSSLQYLDMSGVNLTMAFNLMQVLNTMPSLLGLRLNLCGLHSIHLSYTSSSSNSSFLPRIRLLDMSHNKFNCSLPTYFQNMSSLSHLYLQKTYFNSLVPHWLGNFRNLVVLNLKSNLFTGTEIGLSSIIKFMPYLKTFDLSNNTFLRGDVFGSHDNLSVRFENHGLEILDLSYIQFGRYKISDWLGQLGNLKSLNLSYNFLHGPIPATFENLSNIEYLNLYANRISGGIPTSIGKLSNLRQLHLQFNNLDGVIPDSIGQLQNLEILDFSSNSLKGVVSEILLANLSRLHSIWMGDNSHISFDIKSNWIPPFQLKFFSVRSCKGFGPEFPQWLQTQTQMQGLDLSNTSISGAIPTWLKGRDFVDLALSDNQISGPFPESIGDQMPNLQLVRVDGNRISGFLPQSVCEWKNLKLLYLSRNNFNGTIPGCLFTPSLFIVDVSSNNFSSINSSSIRNCPNLSILMLSKNKLQGELPVFLRNCFYLKHLDLEGNRFTGNIPTWIGERLRNLKVLKLRDNMFNGTIPLTLGLLPHLQILDLALNNLVGSIPPIFINLTSMIRGSIDFETYSTCLQDWHSGTCTVIGMTQVFKSRNDVYKLLGFQLLLNIDLSRNNLVGPIPGEITKLEFLMGLNLSHNKLEGGVPLEIGKMKRLESLDLSFNQLFGPLPESMSDLNFLATLKLSNNNFSGHIPREGHLSTFNDPSSYEGNPYLCGDPLSIKCPSEHPNRIDNFDHHDDQQGEGDKWEKMSLYIIIMVGYIAGFWGVVGALIFKRNWRYAYFGFVEQIHVSILVNIAKFKRVMKRREV